MVWWVAGLCAVCCVLCMLTQLAMPHDGCLRGVFVCRWRQFCVFVRVAVRVAVCVNKGSRAGPGHSADFFSIVVTVCHVYVSVSTVCVQPHCVLLGPGEGQSSVRLTHATGLAPYLSGSAGCSRGFACGLCVLQALVCWPAVLVAIPARHVCCPQQYRLQSNQSKRPTEWPRTVTHCPHTAHKHPAVRHPAVS